MELTHGGDRVGYEEAYGRAPLDFSANASPLGLPRGVRQAVIDALDGADAYPDPLCRALCRAIAQEEGLPRQAVLCGNGAADLIYRFALAAKPGHALLTAPTFAEYEGALSLVGCQVERYPLTEAGGFAVGEGFLEAITPDTDAVFLCEPNNPTGVLTPRPLLLRILEKCEACGARLVVDECFNAFLDDPAAHSLRGRLRLSESLVLLNAFTKLYAMAGLRLGYALCTDERLFAAMREAGQPWGVSSLAQAAGLAALREGGYVTALRALLQSERPWLQGQLLALGFTLYGGAANYLLFKAKQPGLAQKLRERGVLIRDCANYPGLGEGYFRVAVRTHAENELLARALQAICGAP